MADQPDDESGLCVKILNDTNKLYPWTMHWCGEKLPFVCQLQACLDGELLYCLYKCLLSWLALFDGSTARRCTAIVTNERARLSGLDHPVKNPQSASHSFVLQNTIVQASADVTAK